MLAEPRDDRVAPGRQALGPEREADEAPAGVVRHAGGEGVPVRAERERVPAEGVEGRAVGGGGIQPRVHGRGAPAADLGAEEIAQRLAPTSEYVAI